MPIYSKNITHTQKLQSEYDKWTDSCTSAWQLLCPCTRFIRSLKSCSSCRAVTPALFSTSRQDGSFLIKGRTKSVSAKHSQHTNSTAQQFALSTFDSSSHHTFILCFYTASQKTSQIYCITNYDHCKQFWTYHWQSVMLLVAHESFHVTSFLCILVLQSFGSIRNTPVQMSLQFEWREHCA